MATVARGSASWDVQVVGHLCVDLVPTLFEAANVTPGRLIETGPLEVRLGGCVGNTGRDLAALGLRTLMVASLGDDALAGTVASLIDDVPGADHHVAHVTGTSTSYSVVVQAPDTDRAFWHHVGANAVFDESLVDVAAAPILHVGYLPLLPRLIERDGAGLVRLLKAARSAGVTTSIDMCVTEHREASPDWTHLLSDVMSMCDVVSPSLDDLRSAFDDPRLGAADAAAWLLDRGAAVAMVSDGPRGLVVRTAHAPRFDSPDNRSATLLAKLPSSWHGRNVEVVPATGPVVETTGAGDAASAALLAAVHAGLDLDSGLELMRSVAAHRVAGLGSLAGLRSPPLQPTNATGPDAQTYPPISTDKG